MRALSIAALLVVPGLALAEDPPLADIEVGSRSIGGPGLTAAEQRQTAREASGEDDEVLTEETLPPKGNKKRLPGLHKIAGRYFRAQMWKDACDRYDQILDEEGEPGLDTDPLARKQASRVYLECGEIEYRNGKHDKAEALLKKSEKYGEADHRHAGVRRMMLRDTFRGEMQKRNVDKAIAAFKKYQAEKPDEDERIWLGGELAKIAWEAYHAKDKVLLKRAIADAESIAPMNTDLRRLKDNIASEEAVVGNLVKLVGGGVLIVGLLSAFARWRARANVPLEASLGAKKGKNKYLGDDDD